MVLQKKLSKKQETSSTEIEHLEDIGEAQDKTNFILWINTGATVGSFIFSIIMALLIWNK